MEFKRGQMFKRQYKKLDRPVREKFEERLRLLITNESHPLLDNHRLHPPFQAFSSINVTGDWRLLYKKIGPDSYFLYAIGTHHQLYGK
jgi:mRNA-degrading endonuclease YafQ of YafQ-DinJ toxin-antitoxin module